MKQYKFMLIISRRARHEGPFMSYTYFLGHFNVLYLFLGIFMSYTYFLGIFMSYTYFFDHLYVFGLICFYLVSVLLCFIYNEILKVCS